jgi:hypothetical protein
VFRSENPWDRRKSSGLSGQCSQLSATQWSHHSSWIPNSSFWKEIILHFAAWAEKKFANILWSDRIVNERCRSYWWLQSLLLACVSERGEIERFLKTAAGRSEEVWLQRIRIPQKSSCYEKLNGRAYSGEWTQFHLQINSLGQYLICEWQQQ